VERTRTSGDFTYSLELSRPPINVTQQGDAYERFEAGALEAYIHVRLRIPARLAICYVWLKLRWQRRRG